MFIISFTIPLYFTVYAFSTNFPVGKAYPNIQISFIDITFCFLVISNIINGKSYSNNKPAIYKNELLFIIGYFIFSMLSILWAPSSVLVLTGIVIDTKVLIIFLYLLCHCDYIYKNINYVIYGIFGLVLIEFIFSSLQITTGELINFDYLIGFEMDRELGNSWMRYDSYRALGSMGGGPGELSIFMGICIILCLSLTLLPASYKIKCLGLCTATLAAFTLFFAQSRNFIVATVIASIFLALSIKKTRNKIKITGIIIGISLIFIIVNYHRLTTNQSEVISSTADAYELRHELDKTALGLIEESPLTLLIGVGQNNYLAALSNSRQSLTLEMLELPVHNIFLFELVESGIIGISFIFCFIIAVLYNIQIKRKEIYDAPLRYMFKSFLFAYIIFVCIAGNFSWGFLRFYPKCFCLTMLAIAICMLRANAPQQEDKSPKNTQSV